MGWKDARGRKESMQKKVLPWEDYQVRIRKTCKMQSKKYKKHMKEVAKKMNKQKLVERGHSGASKQ